MCQNCRRRILQSFHVDFKSAFCGLQKQLCKPNTVSAQLRKPSTHQNAWAGWNVSQPQSICNVYSNIYLNQKQFHLLYLLHGLYLFEKLAPWTNMEWIGQFIGIRSKCINFSHRLYPISSDLQRFRCKRLSDIVVDCRRQKGGKIQWRPFNRWLQEIHWRKNQRRQKSRWRTWG